MKEFAFPLDWRRTNLSLDGDPRRQPLTAYLPKIPGIRRQLIRAGLDSLGQGEIPRLAYPVTLSRTESDKKAIFTAHNEPELWYLRHHGDEAGFLNEFLQTVKDEPYCTVFDIGGYIGYWSIFAAFEPGVKKVYTFEPNPITRSHLIQNVDKNLLQSEIEVVDDAVSDTVGETTLYFERVVDGSSSLSPNRHSEATPVNTISVDQFCRKMGVAPGIVKIDVEGAEGLVLKGMSRLLGSKQKPFHIFLELHPKLLETQFQTWPGEVINELTRNRYQAVSVRARRNGTLQCHFELK